MNSKGAEQYSSVCRSRCFQHEPGKLYLEMRMMSTSPRRRKCYSAWMWNSKKRNKQTKKPKQNRLIIPSGWSKLWIQQITYVSINDLLVYCLHLSVTASYTSYTLVAPEIVPKNLQSVQFSRSVVSDSLQPHESQHARPPCPSQTPGIYSNSCPSSRWCHPVISSSCHPLLLLPPIPPSIRVFSNKSTLRMRWPKYWSFNFSISPSSEHPGLISFRMDWLDLPAV